MNKCVVCGCEGNTVEVRRLPTRYSDNSKNYLLLCNQCFELRNEYWLNEWKYLRREAGV